MALDAPSGDNTIASLYSEMPYAMVVLNQAKDGMCSYCLAYVMFR